MKAQVLGEVLPLAEQDADAVSAMINLAMISDRCACFLAGRSTAKHSTRIHRRLR
jgi:hypothetical protein